MNPIRKKRLFMVLFLVAGVSIAAALVFTALSENMNLFYAPEKIAQGAAPTDTRIRVGGMVKTGSVQRSEESLDVSFVVSDCKAEVLVRYQGLLPDLFDEGQGVVAGGVLKPNGEFIADEVLAKHDENYMPPEVMEAMQDSHEQGSQACAEQGYAVGEKTESY